MTNAPELYSLLGIAVFERKGLGKLVAVGEPPNWWGAVGGSPGSASKAFEDVPFLEDYLLDAEKFWMSGKQGLSSATVWQAEARGTTLTLDVLTATTGGSRYLLVRNLDVGGIGVTEVMQSARSGRLELSKEINEHLQLQNDLSRAKEAAELLSQAKTQFLANVSHEIRTPLTAILGMTGLLSDTALDAKQQQFVASIQNSSDSLLRIINDLLDFSRVESGKFELESIPFEVASFAEQALLRFQTQARVKGLDFSVDVGDEVPETIHGDPVRLAQIVDNLVGNALKFTDRGYVRVNFGLNPRNDRQLLLFVADSGNGIPEEKQQLIFQSFVQEDASTTRRYGGTGLGLAIVKQLSEMMGGDVSLESRPGRGTTFFVTLPVCLDISSSENTEDSDDLEIVHQQNQVVETKPIIKAETKPKSSPSKTVEASGRPKPLSLLDTYDWEIEDREAEDREAAESGNTALPVDEANVDLDELTEQVDQSGPTHNNNSRLPDWSAHDIGTSDSPKSTSSMRTPPAWTSPAHSSIADDWDTSKKSSQSDDWYDSGAKSNSSDSWFGSDSSSNESPSSGWQNGDSVTEQPDSNESIKLASKGNKNATETKSVEPDEPEWELPASLLRSRPDTTDRVKTGSSTAVRNGTDRAKGLASPTDKPSTDKPSMNKPRRLRRPADINHLTVLLVEDNGVIRMLLTKMLERAGHSTKVAETGRQAVENVSKEVDLVLMDCQMPDMDGFTATKLIRQNEQERGTPRIPIIALTAHAMPGFREKCIAQGMDDYLTKPIKQTDLEATIAKTLNVETQPSI